MSLSSRAVIAAAIALAAGCSVPEIDYTDKTCSPGQCPEGYECDTLVNKCRKLGAPGRTDASTPLPRLDSGTVGEPDGSTLADGGEPYPTDAGEPNPADAGQLPADGGPGRPDASFRPDGGGPYPEDCTNTVDDDHDGLTDCSDSDCTYHAACQAPVICLEQAAVFVGETLRFTAARPDVTWSSSCAGAIDPSNGVFNALNTGSCVVTARVSTTPRTSQAVVYVYDDPQALRSTIAYSGTRSGRIHVSADSTSSGTAVLEPGERQFALHGIEAFQGRTVRVRAFMDTRDMGRYGYVTDPVGEADFTFDGYTWRPANGVGSLLMNDPPTVNPMVIGGAMIFTGSDSALVAFEPARDPNGNEPAREYVVRATSGSASAGVTVPAGLQRLAFFKGLAPGGTYQFAVTTNATGTNMAQWGPTSVTIAAPLGSTTLQGSIALPEGAAGELIVFAGMSGDKGPSGLVLSHQAIALGVHSADFTLQGLSPGDWFVGAFLDRDGNGRIDVTDLTTFGEDGPSTALTVAPGQTNVAANLAFPSGRSVPRLTSELRYRMDNNTTEYAHRWGVHANFERPVAARGFIEGQPPFDLEAERDGDSVGFNRYSSYGQGPVPSGNATLMVRYPDGSTCSSTQPTPSAPQDYPHLLVPMQPNQTLVMPDVEFRWSAPSLGVPVDAYRVWVVDSSRNGDLAWAQLPATQTSFRWSSAFEGAFEVEVAAVDPAGNRASVSVPFKVCPAAGCVAPTFRRVATPGGALNDIFANDYTPSPEAFLGGWNNGAAIHHCFETGCTRLNIEPWPIALQNTPINGVAGSGSMVWGVGGNGLAVHCDDATALCQQLTDTAVATSTYHDVWMAPDGVPVAVGMGAVHDLYVDQPRQIYGGTPNPSIEYRSIAGFGNEFWVGTAFSGGNGAVYHCDHYARGCQVEWTAYKDVERLTAANGSVYALVGGVFTGQAQLFKRYGYGDWRPVALNPPPNGLTAIWTGDGWTVWGVGFGNPPTVARMEPDNQVWWQEPSESSKMFLAVGGDRQGHVWATNDGEVFLRR